MSSDPSSMILTEEETEVDEDESTRSTSIAPASLKSFILGLGFWAVGVCMASILSISAKNVKVMSERRYFEHYFKTTTSQSWNCYLPFALA